jgi:hypothetical protein
MIHTFETIDSEGEPIEKNLASLNDKRYVIYKGKKASFAYQSQVNCPGYIRNGTFVSKQAEMVHLLASKLLFSRQK